MNLVGVTKGTVLEEKMGTLSALEKDGAAFYMALAYVARERGLTELARGLEVIAGDEARHAGMYALMNGLVDGDVDLRSVLTHMADQESKGETALAPLADACRELGLAHAAAWVEGAAKEEVGHGKALYGLIEKHLTSWPA